MHYNALLNCTVYSPTSKLRQFLIVTNSHYIMLQKLAASKLTPSSTIVYISKLIPTYSTADRQNIVTLGLFMVLATTIASFLPK